jgi:molybdopterin converting factor small subunit
VKKTVRVSYYAILREQRGLANEHVSTNASSAAGLYEELRARHGFTLPGSHVRVAINDEFQAWDSPVRDGDSLAFLPPVAGG